MKTDMEPQSPMEFESATELLELCRENNQGIADLVLKRESLLSDKPVEQIQSEMEKRYESMKESIQRGNSLTKKSQSGLSGGDASRLFEYSKQQSPVMNGPFVRLIAYGFAVMETNAQFGRIVATPTAGSAGIAPACLSMCEEQHGVTQKSAAKSLFTAAGIGIIIGKNACFSGAQGGCQAEIGSAAAMAAAAVTEALGGTPEQSINAAAFALMNTLGLVCDPVGGYVEVPCVSRNGMFALHAMGAAAMALSGAQCRIPFDEVVIAMRDIGKRMPRALKETSEAGLATTPTGLRIKLERESQSRP